MLVILHKTTHPPLPPGNSPTTPQQHTDPTTQALHWASHHTHAQQLLTYLCSIWTPVLSPLNPTCWPTEYDITWQRSVALDPTTILPVVLQEDVVNQLLCWMSDMHTGTSDIHKTGTATMQKTGDQRAGDQRGKNGEGRGYMVEGKGGQQQGVLDLLQHVVVESQECGDAVKRYVMVMVVDWLYMS